MVVPLALGVCVGCGARVGSLFGDADSGPNPGAAAASGGLPSNPDASGAATGAGGGPSPDQSSGGRPASGGTAPAEGASGGIGGARSAGGAPSAGGRPNDTGGNSGATGGAGFGGIFGTGGAGTGGRSGTGGFPMGPGGAVGDTGGDFSGSGGVMTGCTSGQKLCGGVCTLPTPNIGCGLIDCTKCPVAAPANGFLKCQDGACDFDCFSGYEKRGGACVTPPQPDGGVAFGDGGVCNSSLCPSCGIPTDIPCCTSENSCNCTEIFFPVCG